MLNEPETSLHIDLIRPLAGLIASAASASQVIVVTHSRSLVDALGAVDELSLLNLIKDDNETRLDGQGLFDEPAWRWAKR